MKILKKESESMNIILFNGGTSNNNTKLVVDSFKTLCEKRGHNVCLLDEYYRDCLACRYCYERRVCCIKDGLTEVIQSFPFDAIVIGTPIFFFHMSAKAKAFLDRFYQTNLTNKILCGLVVGGSPYDSSGVDLIDESIQRTCNYCGSIFAPSFFKCSHDEYTGILTEEDIEALEITITNMEVLFNEIKEN